MKNYIFKFIKREFYINRKLSFNYLLIYLIIISFFAATGHVFGNINRILLFSFVINIFFSTVYFVNIYLQQLKDKELPFILTLPVDKSLIILGKIFYIILVCSIFNGLIYLMIIILMHNLLLIWINSFLANCFISIIIGLTFFKLFLFTSYENFINFSQYVRIIIILAFISIIYIAKLNILNIFSIFNYSPIFPFIIYILVIYTFYKIILIRFQKKKSYL